MFDRPTVALAAKYTALLLATTALLSFGILFYMNRFSGGDYLRDIGVGAGMHAGQDDGNITIANKYSDAVQDRLDKGLLLLNGILVIIVPVVSYRMARSSIKPIQQSLAAQQEFVDNASHEFKTPLAVIIGELQLAVSKKRTSAEYVRAIDSSIAQSKHLAALAQSLLVLARGQDKLAVKDFTEVRLDGLITAVAAMADASAEAKGITISRQAPEDLFVSGNDALLRQMLFNILDNAIKYSSPHSTVNVSAHRLGNEIILQTTDAGPGLSESERKLALRRFWRSNRAGNVDGRGLGLAIAAQIIDLHSGNLRFEEAHDPKGLKVVITLPASA